MNIRDLSIGDWVMAVGAPHRVFSVNHYGVLVDTSQGLHPYNLEFLSPIPLTPEILEKNGFRLVVTNDRFDDWHNHPITIRKYDYEDRYRLIANGYAMPFKMFSVHQLQHALRLLEVDKDIIL